MKKYILSSFAVLVLGLLIIPSFSFAQVGDVDPNPIASDCIALQNNLRYRDRDINKNGEVSTLQDFLQSKGYLNSEPTGYFGLLTFKAVKDFQKANDISPTGYVGPITRAKIKALTCDDMNPSTPSITVLSPNGGEVYTAGQQITVKWRSVNNPYTPKHVAVMLYDDNAGYSNGYSYYLSGNLYNNVGSPDTGSLTANLPPLDHISVNSGDPVKFKPGNNFKIRVSMYPVEYTSYKDSSDNYFTINSGTVDPNLPPGCTSATGYSMTTGLPCYVETVSVTSLTSTSAVLNGYLFRSIPTNVNFAYYKPGTPQIDTQSVLQMNNGPFSATVSNLTPNTLYYFYACATTCARRLEFTTPPSTGGPVISGVSGPQSLNVGQQGTWTIKASDKSNGTLNYSIIWGDEIYPLSSTASNLSIKETRSQSATFTHTYNGGGTYSPKFTVTNESGQSASASLSVNVGTETSTNAKPVLNLIAVSESVNVGQSVNFNFSATDADNDDLSWSVDWGDGGSAGSCQINPPSGTGQNWSHSTSHAWNTAGSYLVKVNVSDCRGGTAETSFTVKVGGTTSQAPIIYSLSQISGPVGTKVVIYGKGFATGPQAITNRPVPVNGDNSINFGSSLIPGITSLDGTSITFIIPSYTTPACLYSAPACKIAQQQIMPGIYPVSVTNTSGTSNAVDFTVTGGGTTQPSITVAYPNGGENIIQGQQIAISWKSNSVSGVFAYLVPETSSYGAGSLGIIGYVSSIYSYMGWDGATVWDSLVNGREIKVPPGKYKIYLVGNVAEKSGQTVSDMSDTSFKIGIDTTYHPADTNKDSRITVSELTAYGNGQYAASASNIWRNGEAYRRDSAQQDWVPTST